MSARAFVLRRADVGPPTSNRPDASSRQAWVHASGYRRGRLDSRKVGVALIEQHVRFVRRHRGRYPQHRCSSAVVPLVAERASRCEIVRSQRCTVEFFDPLLFETGGNRHSHAHESRRKRARLPVHQVLQYGEGIGLCRVYDPAPGPEPSTAPPTSSTAVEWRIALVNDSVGMPGGRQAGRPCRPLSMISSTSRPPTSVSAVSNGVRSLSSG